MALLSFSEIEAGIRAKLRSLDVDLPSLNLKPGRSDIALWRDLGKSLNLVFPRDFLEVVQTYDFDHFCVGGVCFGEGETYPEYLKRVNLHVPPELSWWGRPARPPGVIEVAQTDAHVILLSTANPGIDAFKRGEDWASSIRVAASFDSFVRGAGTAYLFDEKGGDARSVAGNVARELGFPSSSTFWYELIVGIT